MSTSEASALGDFDRWIAEEFASTGAFTALVVLVDFSGSQVTPLCSTYLNVIGDDTDWGEMTVLFAGAGTQWSGAAFFPITAPDGGPVDNPTARSALKDLEARVEENRLIFNEGHFFDSWGRRLKVEEVETQ